MTATGNESSRLLSNSDKSNYKTTGRIGDIEEVTLIQSSNNKAHITISNENDETLKKRLNGASVYTIFSGLYVAVILSSLDSSIVATIYPQIGTEFKRSNEIIWIATSYMLSYTALQPLYGRISDVFGRKSALLFATCVFFIGSLLCGIATNLWTLVVARAIAGVGGGGINCMTTVITSDLIALRERGRFQSYSNIAYAVGSVVGAPLGGFLTDTLGWRSCFYINLPFLLLTIYIATQLLTNYNLEDQEATFQERLKKIDYVGATTIVLSVVSFLIATSLGGNIKPWSDPIVLLCFASSLALVILFCLIEAKYSPYPLMPWEIIASHTPLACSFTNFWCVMATTSLVYITPLFFQALLGFSPSLAGLYILPKVASISIGSVLAGTYMSRTGEYRNITITMALLAFGSMVGYTCWTPHNTSKAFIFTCLTADGLSFGAIITTTLIAMHSCVNHSEMATITSMSYLFRSVGGVIGISLTSAIFQGIVKYILTDRITGPNAELYIEIARKSMTEVRELLPPDILPIVLDAYQIGLRYTYGSCILISSLTVLSTLFIRSYDLSTKMGR
ncbi:MAG: major facilitator superfamily domain-containing protein [Benjaminiella poitrasii]|nr:MAG: major facilitator superfamily domain-containing protein [Benjaminiella poitrasii]